MNKLHVGLILLYVLCYTQSGMAQEANESVTLKYIADYHIAWEDLPEWAEVHQSHTVPLLDSLVDEGVLNDWHVWQHNTGGEYNWRMILVSDDWGNFDVFWDEFFTRLPGDLIEQMSDMIRGHRDQIFEESEIKISASAGPITWAYDSRYQIDFSDLEEWNELRQEMITPILEKAMEQGILAGWVVEDHNTGDRFNRVEVYLFEEWDNIDDFSTMIMGAMMNDPSVWDQYGSMVRDHTDVIWQRVPDESSQ